jgi:transposase
MNSNVISIDLAKKIFQVCLFNEHRMPIINKKVTRANLFMTVMKLDADRIVMEACYSSNYWGREFQALGKKVDLIPPYQVKPFVVGNKNDANDAVAIGEASYRPKAVFVPVKTISQQDIQSLHRIRERAVKTRTAVANQMRGLLSEYGIVLPKKMSVLWKEIPFVHEDAEKPLSTIARSFISDLYDELIMHDKQIERQELALKALLINDDNYQRIRQVPGIGPIVGSALISAVGDARQFKNGRKMSVWIGLTPLQYSSGENSRMGGMSKRGNRTLRKLLIDGARSVITAVENKTDPLSIWIQTLLTRRPGAKVVVALANKLARMAWVVLAKQEQYCAPV